MRMKYLSDVLCNVKRKMNKYVSPISKSFIAGCSATSAFQNIYYAKHVCEEFGDKVALKM